MSDDTNLFSVGTRYCPWCDADRFIGADGECPVCGNSKAAWRSEAPLVDEG